MTTCTKEFILIAPWTERAELEEVPAEGTSPEAEGGDDFERKHIDDEFKDPDSDDGEEYVDTDGNPNTTEVDGYVFPEKEDPMM